MISRTEVERGRVCGRTLRLILGLPTSLDRLCPRTSYGLLPQSRPPVQDWFRTLGVDQYLVTLSSPYPSTVKNKFKFSHSTTRHCSPRLDGTLLPEMDCTPHTHPPQQSTRRRKRNSQVETYDFCDRLLFPRHINVDNILTQEHKEVQNSLWFQWILYQNFLVRPKIIQTVKIKKKI